MFLKQLIHCFKNIFFINIVAIFRLLIPSSVLNNWTYGFDLWLSTTVDVFASLLNWRAILRFGHRELFKWELLFGLWVTAR